MDRKQSIVQGLDLKNSQGLEIGAASKPLLSNKEFDIFYVDHTDKEGLCQKYGINDVYSIEELVDVDFIWNNCSLVECIADVRPDYVIASHVIEHVPDLIKWLNEISSALSSGGELRLAIPDKRFTFDIHRTTTNLSEVLASNIEGRMIPGTMSILDHEIETVFVDAISVWNEKYQEKALPSENLIERALKKAKYSWVNDSYEDAHCWVFTPESFVNIMTSLSIANLLDFECVNLIETRRNEIEFYVWLRKSKNRQNILKSWIDIRENSSTQSKLNERKFRISSALLNSISNGSMRRSGEFIRDVREKISLGLDLQATDLQSIFWAYRVKGGSSVPVCLHLLSDGNIAGYDGPNEAMWRLNENGHLIFLDKFGNDAIIFKQTYLDETSFSIQGYLLTDVSVELVLDPW